ncbi:ice-binding family protein [Streptomyces sp. NBC_01744]|uniref:ice-binding family protein n=1 Tax=Streptomyces sp. NBC_01744 TaxID=2975927 RepID=UPI003D9AA23C
MSKSDLTIAYNDAASRATNTVLTSPGDIGGQTLAPGVYSASSSLNLTGTVTLDAKGDPNAVFIIKIGSTLITAPTSNVSLINGAQACNVFWQVGSSATIDTNSFFKGNILALESITVNTNAAIEGRALARNGAVTLDHNVITRAVCMTGPPGPPGPTGSTGPAGPPGPIGLLATPGLPDRRVIRETRATRETGVRRVTRETGALRETRDLRATVTRTTARRTTATRAMTTRSTVTRLGSVRSFSWLYRNGGGL